MLNEDVLRLILRNVRTPDERRGDLAAQRAAAAIGERRLHELVATHGRDEVLPMPATCRTTASGSRAPPSPPGRTAATDSPTSWRWSRATS